MADSAARRANAFRSLPVIAGALLFLMVLRYVPEVVNALYSYIANSNPEEGFSLYGWKLYYVIVPLCIAGFSRPKQHWPLMIILLLAPVVLALSYWLWEILGWVVIGAYFFVIAILVFAFNAPMQIVVTATIAAVGYAILRILAIFGNEHLLGFADTGFIGILGGYMLVVGIMDVFRQVDEDDKASFGTSKYTSLYITIVAVLLMMMSGSGNWKSIFSLGAQDQTTKTVQTSAPTTAKKTTTDQTAKSDNKKAQAKPVQQSTTQNAKPAKQPSQATSKPAPASKPASSKAAPAAKSTPAPKPAPKLSVFEQNISAANAGNAAACYIVAQCYMNGDGVDKDKTKAFKYMKTAAEGGYTKAYVEVAKMYHGGRGVTKNRDEAERWYMKAAATGDAEAKRILLNM